MNTRFVLAEMMVRWDLVRKIMDDHTGRVELYRDDYQRSRVQILSFLRDFAVSNRIRTLNQLLLASIRYNQKHVLPEIAHVLTIFCLAI